MPGPTLRVGKLFQQSGCSIQVLQAESYSESFATSQSFAVVGHQLKHTAKTLQRFRLIACVKL
jgi:hypothetical protein